MNFLFPSNQAAFSLGYLEFRNYERRLKLELQRILGIWFWNRSFVVVWFVQYSGGWGRREGFSCRRCGGGRGRGRRVFWWQFLHIGCVSASWVATGALCHVRRLRLPVLWWKLGEARDVLLIRRNEGAFQSLLWNLLSPIATECEAKGFRVLRL